MSATEDRGIVWECGGCGTFMREPDAVPPGHRLIMPMCSHAFPGYEVLPMLAVKELPGETLREYHQRVYGRPYPHEDRWPGTNLAWATEAKP